MFYLIAINTESTTFPNVMTKCSFPKLIFVSPMLQLASFLQPRGQLMNVCSRWGTGSYCAKMHESAREMWPHWLIPGGRWLTVWGAERIQSICLLDLGLLLNDYDLPRSCLQRNPTCTVALFASVAFKVQCIILQTWILRKHEYEKGGKTTNLIH